MAVDYEKKFNEINKKHQVLAKRFQELENLERQLEENTELSEEKRLQNLTKLSTEYEKIANLMQELVKEAEMLNNSIQEEIDSE